MKKIFLSIALLSLGLAAGAQGVPDKISTPAQFESNFRNTLWFNSANVSGMAFSPLALYNDLNLYYEHASGDYKLMQSPGERNNVKVNTSGAFDLKGFKLQGDFSFHNNYEQGTKFNAIRYEAEDDMPYFLADTVVSGWIKQEYLLGAKIASPVLWDKVSFGVGVKYNTRVGAKQRDPRCEVYKFNVEVTPSVSVRLGNFVLGANFLYDNLFERSHPHNEGTASKIIWIMRGFGESQKSKVGDNDGIKTCFYKGNTFGGGLQLQYKGDFEILGEFKYSLLTFEAFNNISLPKRMGTIRRPRMEAILQALAGSALEHKISLKGIYRPTAGLEYIQQLNPEAFNQRWEVLAVNQMSSYNLIAATLVYDWEAGTFPSGYKWKAGASLDFNHTDNSYVIPASNEAYTSCAIGLRGARHWRFSASGLILSLDAKYNKSLEGHYVYAGSDPASPLQELFTSDSAYYGADWFRGGADLLFYFYKKNGGSYYFDVAATYLRAPAINKYMLGCLAKIGIHF